MPSKNEENLKKKILAETLYFSTIFIYDIIIIRLIYLQQTLYFSTIFIYDIITDYKTVLKDGNIKFVQRTSNESETIMETMTKGRVYAIVNKENELSSIIYFDKENKRNKQIDLKHNHNKESPHTHHGYLHNEKDNIKGYSKLTTEEKKMVERISKIWYNNISK